MLGFNLNSTIDQLAMASSVPWYGVALRREGGHALSRALDFEVEGQRKKREPKGHERSRLRKKVRRLIYEGKIHFADQCECWYYSDCCRVEVNLATLT